MSELCQDLIKKAFAYLCAKTQTWEDDAVGSGIEAFGAAIRSEEGRGLARAIDTAALANDYTATAHACRAYWKHILAHAPQERNYAGQ